ncbi:hypothetical protein IV102_13545 [bacterium]|nr:hypothetical protein [bacterium]
MNENAELPPLTRSCLDAATLEALLDDLSSLTEILEVTVKGGQFDRSEKTCLALRPAVKALQAGLVRGVQIRYLWHQEQWLDTLLVGRDGIRIVRIQVS